MHATPTCERPSPVPRADPTGSQRAPVLLVVEDNAVAREGLAAVLRQGGYEVLTARDGQEALDRLRAGLVPDLILLDMLMDGVDGWRFLAALQHWPQRPSVPIIITTGTILTREWAEQNGCQGFLNKPIEVDALFEEVERCLGHTR